MRKSTWSVIRVLASNLLIFAGIGAVVALLQIPASASSPQPQPVATLAPGCQHIEMQPGSSAQPFKAIECGGLKKPVVGKIWLKINDGADNDWDAGDVIQDFQIPTSARLTLAKRIDNVLNITNSSCAHEFVVAKEGNLPNPWASMTWEAGENGCGWYMREHAHCANPRLGTDQGWLNGGWVISTGLEDKVTCSNPNVVIESDLQWHTHSNPTVHTKRAF